VGAGQYAVQRINGLLSPDNTERFGSTLENLEQTTGVIAEQADEIRRGAQALVQAGQQADETLKEAAITLREAAETVRQASQFLEHGNRLLDTHGENIFENASSSMASLDRTMTRIDSLMARNQDAMDDAIQGTSEIGPAIRELRMTLNALQSVARRLDEDPAGFLMGRDGIKEFNP
jgi:phospholipid/cholesterol/gamma-HCH transport system substrate-binding protein